MEENAVFTSNPNQEIRCYEGESFSRADTLGNVIYHLAKAYNPGLDSNGASLNTVGHTQGWHITFDSVRRGTADEESGFNPENPKMFTVGIQIPGPGFDYLFLKFEREIPGTVFRLTMAITTEENFYRNPNANCLLLDVNLSPQYSNMLLSVVGELLDGMK